MLKDFKDFLMRGNVIDLAVAVVLGTAFTAVVSSVVKGVIEPILATVGGHDAGGLGFRLVSDKPATFIGVGSILTAIIDFIIIAAVLYFVMLVPIRKLMRGKDKSTAATEVELLTEIRDLLQVRN